MEKPFEGKDVGIHPINLTKYPTAYQLIPFKIIHKEDGDICNQPSFCILMKDPKDESTVVFGQISLRMFNQGLKDIGYELKKIEDNVTHTK